MENFLSFVRQIKDLSLTILEHSHIPYQHIVEQTKCSPVHILYECATSTPMYDSIEFDKTAGLVPYIQKQYYHFDQSWSVHYLPQDKHILLTLDASADVFDAGTVRDMVYRFELAINQLIYFPHKPIFAISLLLPNESNLIQSNYTPLEGKSSFRKLACASTVCYSS